METNGYLARLGIAAGLGLLVGLQRERAGSRFGGIRTFPLLTVLGAVAALLAQHFGSGWIIAAGLVSLAILAAASNFLSSRHETHDPGMTTEVAALLMYSIGAFSIFGPPAIVMAAGVGVALLLYAKEGLHGFTDRLGEKDMRAIMLFAAITFIILPVLPDRTFGPLSVLNPRNIWLMVVLVVGISLGGYVAYKAFGSRAGAILSGVLGGLISSTATTATYARRAAADPASCRPAMLVIIIAGSIVYLRVLTEVSIVAPDFFPTAATPILAMFATSAALCLALWLAVRGDAGSLSEPDNPTQLKSALLFAAMYAGVTLAVALAQRYFQHSGLYIVAAISGLTDMDAITLSTSRLVHEGTVSPSSGWRAIIIASMSNILFKTGLIAALSGSKLFRLAAAVAAVKLGAAILLLTFLD